MPFLWPPGMIHTGCVRAKVPLKLTPATRLHDGFASLRITRHADYQTTRLLMIKRQWNLAMGYELDEFAEFGIVNFWLSGTDTFRNPRRLTRLPMIET